VDFREADVTVQTGVISRDNTATPDGDSQTAQTLIASTVETASAEPSVVPKDFSTVSEEPSAVDIEEPSAVEVEEPSAVEVEEPSAVAREPSSAEKINAPVVVTQAVAEAQTAVIPVEEPESRAANIIVRKPSIAIASSETGTAQIPEETVPVVTAPQQTPNVALVTNPAIENSRIDSLTAENTLSPPSLLKPPVSMVPSGLAELRMEPTAKWLADISSKNGYTIVLFSVPSTNPNGLEEYLQFLQLVSLLDDTYICFKPISSSTSGRWQVMYREFQGVTPARNLLRKMPEYILQYDPYLTNINAIKCTYPVEVGY
jgi:hypothetical protein